MGPLLGRIGIWGGDFDRLPVAQFRTVAATLDELGFGTLWLPETTGREAVAQAAIALAVTSRITIATGVASVYARDPHTAAAAWRTLDEAYPGRFVLGLGVSHPALATDLRGHPWRAPVPAMRQYLETLDRSTFGPTDTPVQRVIAALGPALTRLAGDRQVGVLPLGMPVAHTRATRAVLGPDRLLAVVQLVALGDHGPQLARDATEAAMPNRRPLLGDDIRPDDLVAVGDLDAVAARVRAQLDAGADHVGLHVLSAGDTAPLMSHWGQLADRLLRTADW